jgi:outer membrane protein insertion porin family
MRILLLSWLLLSAACSTQNSKNSLELNEQKLIQVEDVLIVGNSVLSADELRNKIEISPGLIEAHKLKEMIDLDIKRLRFEYLNTGYFKVNVSGPSSETLKNSKVRVIFNIDEGLLYRVRDIRFEGDLLFSESKLKKLVTLRKGEPYSFKKIELSLEALNKAYKTAKYPFVDITPKPIVDELKQEIDTVFVINKGKRQP